MKSKLNWALIGTMAFAIQAYAKPNISVKDFSLINAETGEVIEGYQKIQDGADINLDQLPTNSLSIRANTKGKSKSVQFELDSSYSYTSNSEPAYLCGTTVSGDKKVVTPCDQLSAGNHNLSATPFSKKDGMGDKGQSLSIKFAISGPATPNPEPTSTPNPEPTFTPNPQ